MCVFMIRKRKHEQTASINCWLACERSISVWKLFELIWRISAQQLQNLGSGKCMKSVLVSLEKKKLNWGGGWRSQGGTLMLINVYQKWSNKNYFCQQSIQDLKLHNQRYGRCCTIWIEVLYELLLCLNTWWWSVHRSEVVPTLSKWLKWNCAGSKGDISEICMMRYEADVTKRLVPEGKKQWWPMSTAVGPSPQPPRKQSYDEFKAIHNYYPQISNWQW